MDLKEVRITISYNDKRDLHEFMKLFEPVKHRLFMPRKGQKKGEYFKAKCHVILDIVPRSGQNQGKQSQ